VTDSGFLEYGKEYGNNVAAMKFPNRESLSHSSDVITIIPKAI
jgi:hypothetical protein